MFSSCCVTVNGDGDTVQLAAEYNEPLFRLLIKHGLIDHLESSCGGKGLCGKCMLKASGRLSVMTAEERSLLGNQADKGYRLACFCYIKGDVVIALPQRVQPGLNQSESVLDTRYGFSVDLGITAVNIFLHNLRDKSAIDVVEAVTATAYAGKDRNSLIAYIAQHPGEQKRLHDDLVAQLDELMQQLLQRHMLDRHSVEHISFVGNTCMHHILGRVDMTPLSRPPYEPLTKDSLTFSATELGFRCAPNAQVQIAGVISDSIGSDVAADALVTGMYKSLYPVLMLDFGAEAEVVLGNKNLLLVSNARDCGVFHGIGVSCGATLPGKGVICKLWKEKYKIYYETNDNSAPVGLYGSALIDAIQIMLSVGIIDTTGRMLPASQLRPSKLRMLGQVNGEQVFYISKKDNIYITQQDVRIIQKAKASVLASIQMLIEHFEMDQDKLEDELSGVYLVGVFSGLMDIHNAIKIGLLPRKLEKISFGMGNAAAEGAGLLLHSPRARANMEHIRTYARHIEFTQQEKYMQYYQAALEFRSF